MVLDSTMYLHVHPTCTLQAALQTNLETQLKFHSSIVRGKEYVGGREGRVQTPNVDISTHYNIVTKVEVKGEGIA